MLKDKLVAVVVPAYKEEKQIGEVLRSMPEFVDRIIVVDDCSGDKTSQEVTNCIKSDKGFSKTIKAFIKKTENNKYNGAELVLQKEYEKELSYYIPADVLNKNPETDRIILIRNKINGGVGASIARGYKWCLDHHIDCTAVMAGDGQMDPNELESICMPVVLEGIDYVKGNRLIHRSAWLVIPRIRYFGNSVLSILTKIASGYWRVSDTQCGYTAISLKALEAIRIHDIYGRYGMPNDLLVKLNIAFCTIKEVEIKPVYNIGEKSKMNLLKVTPSIILLLGISFFKRLWTKYCFRDFHPLFLLYNFSFLLAILMVPYAIKITNLIRLGEKASYETLLIFIFLFTSSFQSFFFAMWMDMQDNERLYK